MTEPASSGGSKLVLIVDDDKGVREYLQIVVSREGYRAETAADGAEGLRKARALMPDLILLDLMLPQPGGFEIVHELQGEETGGIPIIVITGRYMDRSTAEMIKMESNVKEYIEKPIKKETLAALLRQLLKPQAPAK